MSFLLDTHVIWWAIVEPEQLRPHVATLLKRANADLCYNALSLFELSIKRAKRQLFFEDAAILDEIRALKLKEIFLRPSHGLGAGALPPHHRDPFDRMLIAIALEEGLTLISRDKLMRLYDVPILEA